MSAPTAASARLPAWIFLFLACVYLATSGGHFYTGDGIEMFKTAESLVLRGDLAIVPGPTGRLWGYEGADGRRYTPYALGLSLVEAPLFAAGDAAGALLRLPAPARARLAQAAAVWANALASAATSALLCSLMLALGYRGRAAAGVALIHGLGTMAWVYSKHDFAEPLATLCLVGAALHLVRAGEEGRPAALLLAGAFNGGSFFTKYHMVVYTPIFLAYLAGDARRAGARLAGFLARSAWFLGPGLLFGVANLAVNHARFGTWLQTGYARQGEIFAGWGFLPAGAFGLLLSPGKGLFWYSPLLLAVPFAWKAFHARDRRASLLAAAVIGATFLTFAPLWWWHGDWAWGPRYLLLILPFAVMPLGAWLDAPDGLGRRVAGAIRLKHVLAALLAAALVVNALGLAVNFFHYLQALRDQGRVHDEWNFVPNLSPIRFHAHIVRGWLLAAAGAAAPDFRYRAWCDGELLESVIPLDRFPQGGLTPDFFFFRPRDTAAERAVLGAAGLVLLAGALLCGRRLRAALLQGRA